MIDKNKKKEENKKRRNVWTIKPITHIVESKKGYNRARDRKDKKLYYD